MEGDTEADFVKRLLEVGERTALTVVTRRDQRRFVAKIGQVGAIETDGSPRQHAKSTSLAKLQFAGMNPQDALASFAIGQSQHLPIESSRTNSAGSSTSGRLVAARRSRPGADRNHRVPLAIG